MVGTRLSRVLVKAVPGVRAMTGPCESVWAFSRSPYPQLVLAFMAGTVPPLQTVAEAWLKARNVSSCPPFCPPKAAVLSTTPSAQDWPCSIITQSLWNTSVRPGFSSPASTSSFSRHVPRVCCQRFGCVSLLAKVRGACSLRCFCHRPHRLSDSWCLEDWTCVRHCPFGAGPETDTDAQNASQGAFACQFCCVS